MKQKMLISAALLCLLYYFAGSAFIPVPQPDTEKKKFSYSKFAENLKKRLDDTTTGYGISIYGKGVLVEHFTHGDKRTHRDGGDIAFENSSRLFIASMSKTLTAIATIQLLKADGLTPNTLIKDYLPPDWELGQNIDKITFRDLLTHMSGIRANGPQDCNGELYKQLRCKISKGVKLDSMAVQSYQNMNFALLRIIIPKLEGFNHLPGEANDTSTANKYVRYVHKNVFDKCGLNGRALTHPDLSENVWYYALLYPGLAGQRFPGDWTPFLGAYGWFVSVDDYATVINKLFHSDKLLDKAWRDTMTTDGLGCYTYGGDHGGYYWHNGGWSDSETVGDGNLNTCWMYYPENDVMCVAMVNSDIPAWFPDILAHEYDKAWK